MVSRRHSASGLLAVALVAAVAQAQEPLEQDGVLAALIDEALQARPELAQARAEAQAARERVPQARALPDPMLQVGVQNDGFDKWQVGKMETSWILFMASQTVPFPGKRDLRGELADADARRRDLAAERARLGTIADVRRAYLSMQLAEARLELLAKLTALLEQAVTAAQGRYEAGEGPLSDVLRARLEVARLRQQRFIAEAEVRLQRQTLNRLRGRPLEDEVAGARPFPMLAFPAPPDEATALAQFRAQSPELLAAATDVTRAERGKALGQRSYFPDFSVAAGVMVRGALDPMWTVAVGVPLPVYAGTKQSRAVAEATAVLEAASKETQTLDQLLALRTGQRLASWRALSDVWRGYQDGLLADAEATAGSTLEQYRVGRVPFASVLEASTAAIGVVDASYGVLADAWRLAIAQDELSLAEVGVAAAPMGASVPGTGGMAGSPRGMGATGSADNGAGAEPGPATGM